MVGYQGEVGSRKRLMLVCACWAGKIAGDDEVMQFEGDTVMGSNEISPGEGNM